MERYAVPVAPITENPKPIKRSQWKRSLIETTGISDRSYRHDVSSMLIQSYSEIGAFVHKYHYRGAPCKTHLKQMNFHNLELVIQYPSSVSNIRGLGVAALEFDTQGIYLASVTRSGCLTVHDFESLYCESNGPVLRMVDDQRKHLLHTRLLCSLDAVRWNPANQDEVVCTSLSTNDVSIYDIAYVSADPSEILTTRPAVTVHGSSARTGLSDIAFLNDKIRIIAADTFGAIHIWDRRASNLPQSGLTTHANSGLTSIQLDGDQGVYGATKSGFIYIWDLRGGRSAAALQSHSEVHSSPITSVKLASLLNKIGPLKAQSNIVAKEIQSIGINPSCPYQLAFHLDDGWSGVLDIHNFQVSHIHCPPPPWLDQTNLVTPPIYLRKPAWLHNHSIYAVGSSSSNGLHLLDFNPNTSSPCHVDHDDSKETFQRKQNKLIPLSERVIACASHPLNGTIVAGTMDASLLMISQKRLSYQKGGEDEEEEEEEGDADAIEEGN